MKQDGLDRHSYFIHQLRPQDWFPTASEVGMENSPSYAAWDAYLDTKTMFPVQSSDPELPGILQVADQSGELWDQLPQESDPWKGLHALNMAWLESKLDYSQALDENFDEFERLFGSGPYDGKPRFIYRNREAHAWYDAHDVNQDYSYVLQIIDALKEQHPGHTVNDFALLFELDALSNVVGEQYDSAAASDLAMSILEITQDPLVAEAAVQALAHGRDAQLSEADWATLEQAALEFPYQGNTIAVYALDACFSAGDHARAAHWLKILEASVSEHCDCGAIRAGDSCEITCDWVSGGTRQLQALGTLAPQTWQQALQAQVVHCSWETEHPKERVLAQGSWDQGWHWTNFGAEGDFATCVQAATVDEPLPELGQVVELVVHPY